jgi:hypothetical protein
MATSAPVLAKGYIAAPAVLQRSVQFLATATTVVHCAKDTSVLVAAGVTLAEILVLDLSARQPASVTTAAIIALAITALIRATEILMTIAA